MVQQLSQLASAHSSDYLFSSHSNIQMDLSTNTQHPTVCKHALLKKVKTNKYKFFVLHKDSPTAPARIEYYRSESHWIKNKKARRAIYLKTCFSINAFSDTRTKFGLTIFTKDDSFQIGFDGEQERDMWLADIRHLSHISCDQSRSIVEHMWIVCVQTRNMKHSIEGNFKLCLNEHQASLISKRDSEKRIILSLDVITKCVHKDNYCAMELNENSPTGAGEIWLELEDSLIAQHVHRAFLQNLSMNSPGADSFRPVSRSLSFKDRSSALNARLRSGSDAKQRNRNGLSLYKIGQHTSSFISSLNSSMGFHRDRSDSMDSQSTTASLSTDESECCRNGQCSSRAGTPDLRLETAQPNYLAMGGSRSPADHSHNPVDVADHSYADMSSGSRSHDRNSNFMYIDMSSNHSSHCPDSQSNKNKGYLDMTRGQNSLKYKGFTLKQEPVKCYLLEDSDDTQPKMENHSSPRPQASPITHTNEYVEMCRGKKLADKDKSSSAPHLMPVLPNQPYQCHNDNFMNMDFDHRDRTVSLSCPHRPRGSSWSQFVRPRSSTTEQKHRTRSQKLLNTGLKPHPSDYIDMTCGTTPDSYVEMSPTNQKLPTVRSTNQMDDKENRLPNSRSSSQVHIDPFPELSASSEDDVSLHSLDGSVSIHSLTSSADSMSLSSHSSHHGAFTSTLDSEPYVAMQPAPASHIRVQAHHRMSFKPARVASYITDESPSDKSKPQSPCTDYMDMSPTSVNKNTKQ